MTLLPPLWRHDAKSVHHLLPETETILRTGHANPAGTVLTNITSDTHEMTTASGTPRLVHITNRSSTTAKVARQATTDNKEITPSDSTTACMAGLETANPTKDEVDIHEMHGDQVDRKALNSCDLTQHPQNSVLV